MFPKCITVLFDNLKLPTIKVKNGMAMASSLPLRQDAQIIALVGVAHAVSHFFHLILASLFPWLKEAFHLSFAELGFLMSVFFLVSGIGQALAGFVVDRLGARVVLFFGVTCLVVSALVLSAAQNYATLLMGSMVAGLGNSVFHPSDFTLLNKRISLPRLGHAFSVHGISGNLGWAAAPLFLTTVAAMSGWRNALLAAAVIPFALLVLLFIYRDTLWYDKVQAEVVASKASKHVHALDFMRRPAVWMCFSFFVTASMALAGIQSFSSFSLRSLYGMSLQWAAVGYAAYMLAGAGGMVWGGFIVARTTRHDHTIAFSFSVAAITAFVISAGIVSSLFAVVLMGVIGFAAGIALPSRDLLIRIAAPPNATGRVYGVVYSGGDIGFAVAPVLFGMMMDGNHPSWVFVCIGIIYLLTIGGAVSACSSAAKREKRDAIVTAV